VRKSLFGQSRLLKSAELPKGSLTMIWVLRECLCERQDYIAALTNSKTRSFGRQKKMTGEEKAPAIFLPSSHFIGENANK
jgi:hypothetical protein